MGGSSTRGHLPGVKNTRAPRTRGRGACARPGRGHARRPYTLGEDMHGAPTHWARTCTAPLHTGRGHARRPYTLRVLCTPLHAPARLCTPLHASACLCKGMQRVVHEDTGMSRTSSPASSPHVYRDASGRLYRLLNPAASYLCRPPAPASRPPSCQYAPAAAWSPGARAGGSMELSPPHHRRHTRGLGLVPHRSPTSSPAVPPAPSHGVDRQRPSEHAAWLRRAGRDVRG
jgi:hypothetical protein